MPVLGLGTVGIQDPAAVVHAVKDGYRLFDCASRYANEQVIGQGLKMALTDNLVKREDIFVVSKVWWSEVEDCELACRASLEKLGLEHLDLYLVHWPIA